MLDSNDNKQESSAVQHDENDLCPNCSERVQGITRRGPTDATAQPCGCNISTRPRQDCDEVTA